MRYLKYKKKIVHLDEILIAKSKFKANKPAEYMLGLYTRMDIISYKTELV